VVDYVYLMLEGKIVAAGPTAEMVASKDPFVEQFLHAKPEGPVPFHSPGLPYDRALGFA